MNQLTKTCERCLKCLVVSEGSIHTCTPPSEYWANVEQQRDKLLAALKESREELRACQAVIHLAGGFDPAYVSGAQKSMKRSYEIIKEIEETK